jgi:hypothetical protein
MRKAFLEFLESEGVLAPEQAANLRTLYKSASEPIGLIAFSFGMINGADIDLILDQQRRDYRPFGQIAMEMGMLTRQQVQTLLRVQQVRGATETAEALVLSGVCPMDSLMNQLGKFFMAKAESPLAALD